MANTKIYLGNLRSVTAEQLKAHFAQYGEIVDVILPTDRETNAIKGYGFINFAEEASAQSALVEDGSTAFGGTMSVQIATEKKRGKKKQ